MFISEGKLGTVVEMILLPNYVEVCYLGRQKGVLTLVSVKKFGRGNIKYAYKTLDFITEDGTIIRWGTKTKKNYEVGFNARCSFIVVKKYIENNELVIVVENLRVNK